MNVELLQQVKAHILAEPDAFRMDTWSCGTAHCIAGWALLLNDIPIKNPREHALVQETISDENPSSVARELLGLGFRQAQNLFFISAWPDAFSEQFAATKSRGERAQIAAKRIDHFIATNGAQ